MRSYNLRMAIPSRASRPGTFFVTTSTYNRRRLFQAPTNAELFIETLQHYRRAGHYKLHAFVVMPDHVHFILTPQVIALERAVGFIKGGFSHRLGSKTPVWQRGFTDHRIRDAEDMQTRRDYLHQNPVRANLVAAAQLYPYSSAYQAEHDLSG
jgi:REP-associated tyrosine transposase